MTSSDAPVIGAEPTASPKVRKLTFTGSTAVYDAFARKLVERAAKLVVGPGTEPGVNIGPLVEPADVTPAMRIAREETFDPGAPLLRFRDEAEAVSLANDTEFGLAAYFYGRDLGRVRRVAEALEYGMVAVNTGALSSEVAPFGGMKESGIGREGSRYGIDDFIEIKYVCFGGIEP